MSRRILAREVSKALVDLGIKADYVVGHRSVIEVTTKIHLDEEIFDENDGDIDLTTDSIM